MWIFWLFFFFFCTRFAHALHSSVHIYLEIENLIGLGGFFNNKLLDLWVLLKKRAKKGNFYLLLLFLDESFIYFSHGPKETSPTLNLQSRNILLCFRDLHCNQNLPFCQEESFAISLQPPLKSVGHLGNRIWEHFGNLMGTWWEHIGSKKKKKKSLAPPFQKEKKWTILIGCMKFLFPKMFITNILPGLR